MEKLAKYLLWLSFIFFGFGPIAGFPLNFPGVSFYFLDFLALVLFLFFLFNFSKFWVLVSSDKILSKFFLFVSIAFLSLIFSPVKLDFFAKIVSFFYLLRLFAYSAYYLAGKMVLDVKVFSPKKILKILSYLGVILSFFGWFQYFLYPDLRNLFYLGWDPHYKRIFGTFFDPNFLGLLLVLSFWANFFSFGYRSLSSLFRLFFLSSTLAFTYSRSSFISFLGTFIYYAVAEKKIHWLRGVIIAMVLVLLFLPRPGGEGVKLERFFSVKERLKTWELGLKIFSRSPFLGVGFNTLRYAKNQYFGQKEEWLTSHSGAGVDNSFIFILSTTGLLGLITYLFFLYQVFQTKSLLVKTSFLAGCLHSLFLNSLFFPWVMFWLWLVLVLQDLGNHQKVGS